MTTNCSGFSSEPADIWNVGKPPTFTALSNAHFPNPRKRPRAPLGFGSPHAERRRGYAAQARLQEVPAVQDERSGHHSVSMTRLACLSGRQAPCHPPIAGGGPLALFQL